jgi:hypothetical protein
MTASEIQLVVIARLAENEKPFGRLALKQGRNFAVRVYYRLGN